jgi:hypothetical protein
MKMHKLSKRHLIVVILLAWLSVIGFDFFLHGGLLAKLYTQASPFLLTPEKAFQRIPLGYASFLIFEIFLVWLMIRLNLMSWKPGLVLGLQVGAFTWGALVLGLFSISTANLGLLAGWFIGQTIEAGIGGTVTGLGLASQRPGRLAIYVIIFVLIAIFITVLLQSTGLAPAMKIVTQ